MELWPYCSMHPLFVLIIWKVRHVDKGRSDLPLYLEHTRRTVWGMLRQPLSLPLIVTRRIFIYASVLNKNAGSHALSLCLSQPLSLMCACLKEIYKKHCSLLKGTRVNKILPLHATALNIIPLEDGCKSLLIWELSSGKWLNCISCVIKSSLSKLDVQ